MGLALGVILLDFLLRDGAKLPTWGTHQLADGSRQTADAVLATSAATIREYVTGRALVAGFEAVTISVGAALLGVPLWQAVGVVTFVGGFIPYFGAFLAGMLAVVLALTKGGLSTALLMLGVVLVVQNLLEPLLEAKVLGHTMNLHPMLVIVATTTGGIAAGVAGLILATPLLATLVRARAATGS